VVAHFVSHVPQPIQSGQIQKNFMLQQIVYFIIGQRLLRKNSRKSLYYFCRGVECSGLLHSTGPLSPTQTLDRKSNRMNKLRRQFTSTMISIIASIFEFYFHNYILSFQLYEFALLYDHDCVMALHRCAFMKRYGRVTISIKEAMCFEERIRKIIYNPRYQITDTINFEHVPQGIATLSMRWCWSIKSLPFFSYLVGTYLYNSNIHQVDDSKVFELIEYAAHGGITHAMNLYANLILQSALDDKVGLHNEPTNDREQQLRKAIEHYSLAASLQDPAALYNIGTMYERGLGVGQNLQTAIEFYCSAARLGSPHAWNVLGVLAEQGSSIVNVQLNRDGESASGKRWNAIELYRRASSFGLAHGLYNYARCLNTQPSPCEEKSNLLKDNPGHANSEALVCFQKAAEDGHTMSILAVAIMYDFKMVHGDSYQRISTSSMESSLSTLSIESTESTCTFGTGISTDSEKEYTNMIPYNHFKRLAYKYYEKAAVLGSPEGRNRVSEFTLKSLVLAVKILFPDPNNNEIVNDSKENGCGSVSRWDGLPTELKLYILTLIDPLRLFSRSRSHHQNQSATKNIATTGHDIATIGSITSADIQGYHDKLKFQMLQYCSCSGSQCARVIHIVHGLHNMKTQFFKL
jgi:TPR repeat protein